MTEFKPLRTPDLRYLLLSFLQASGEPMTVAELAREVEKSGFTLKFRASKAIPDALRTEINLGRVSHRPRGPYRLVHIPRTSRRRIDLRLRDLRAELAAARTQSNPRAAA